MVGQAQGPVSTETPYKFRNVGAIPLWLSRFPSVTSLLSSFLSLPSSVVTGLMLLLLVFASGGWEGASAHASPPQKRQTRFVSQRPDERTPATISSEDREVILRLQFLLYLDMLENLQLYQHFDLLRQVHALATTGVVPPAKKP